ncbi:MAG: ABC transporter ATP-binding protein, partial [Tannerella sp.]|nr:ABC transporter ATP-binding protein [Tannerella sp.]
ILDEPTNHLDMRSKDVLKEALRDFDGTLIVVSHDREFLDGLVNKVYEFGNRRVKEHLGGIYEFLERRKIENLRELERRTPPENGFESAPADGKTPSSSAKRSYEEQKEQSRIVRRLEKSIAEAERKITRLEREIAETEQQMSTPEGAANASLYAGLEALKQQLSETMDEWTEQTLELEHVLS